MHDKILGRAISEYDYIQITLKNGNFYEVSTNNVTIDMHGYVQIEGDAFVTFSVDEVSDIRCSKS